MPSRGLWGKGTCCALVAAALAVLPPGTASAADRRCRYVDTPMQGLQPANARSALRCLLAARRRERSLPALKSSTPLRRMAQELADDLVHTGRRGHKTSKGEDLDRRARRHLEPGFRKRWELGEALSWGSGPFSTPAALVDTLVRSAAHRRLLDDRRYAISGVAVAVRGDTAVAVVELARKR